MDNITSATKKAKVYYFPSASKGGYDNPYSVRYKKALAPYFRVLDSENKSWKVSCLPLLCYSFVADVFILNWLENIPFYKMGTLQYLVARFALSVIKIRKKKIVWMYHNIHPHKGENRYTKRLQSYLAGQASLIVSHSVEAAEYIRGRGETRALVIYRCHPVAPIEYKIEDNKPYNDVFIWGSILPYKGVVEFLREADRRKSPLKILILGRCIDENLTGEIEKFCNKDIVFSNRRADFDEIASYIAKSRYVLFPYVGDCVSGSGALIDTIAMGGHCCGPDKGAFRDLQKEGMVTTYQTYSDLFQILPKREVPEVGKNLQTFMRENSWEKFGAFISREIMKMV